MSVGKKLFYPKAWRQFDALKANVKLSNFDARSISFSTVETLQAHSAIEKGYATTPLTYFSNVDLLHLEFLFF